MHLCRDVRDCGRCCALPPLPLCPLHSGWALGSALVCALAVWNALTLVFVARAGAACGCTTVDRTVQRLLGHTAFRLYQVFLVISSLGTLILALVLVG